MRTVIIIAITAIFLGSVYRTFVAAPTDFPASYHLTVTAGETSSAISHQLVADGAIRSRRTFQLLMVALGGSTRISEGDYYFAAPSSALTIALRLSGKEFGITRTNVTFPEGYSNDEMAARLKTVFPEFDSATYLKQAASLQGYLFPDTYGFFVTPLPAKIIADQQRNYEEKIGPLRADIVASGHTEAEIITMASIVEKEARGSTDSPVIAGILWKRVENGMLLQVDAVPSTYHKKGLPPAPINNPGLTAIEAALHPTASPYVYYLHDRNGNVHYASTYQQHQQNIKQYL